MSLIAKGEPQSGPNGIVVRHFDRVHRYLRRRMRGQPADADDLAQEVCVRFLKSYGGQPLACPVAYLLAIASHTLADFIKCAKREQGLLTFDSDLLGDYSDGGAQGPMERVMAEFDLPRLLLHLPRTQRAVLEAHALQGYSYVEVAQRLGLTELTVEKYLTQARAQLREEQRSRKVRRAARP